jgi:lactam utilization protein B
MTSTLRSMAVFLVIFVCGVISGTAISQMFHGGQEHPLVLSEDRWLDRHYAQTVGNLDLSSDQAAHIEEQYSQLKQAVGKVRIDTRQQIKSLFVQHTKAVLQTLTPQQREAFRQRTRERFFNRRPLN